MIRIPLRWVIYEDLDIKGTDEDLQIMTYACENVLNQNINLIGLDFADIVDAFEGTTICAGMGSANGPDSQEKAFKAALDSLASKCDTNKMETFLICVLSVNCESSLVKKTSRFAAAVKQTANENAYLMIGAACPDNLKDQIEVIIIATDKHPDDHVKPDDKDIKLVELPAFLTTI